MSNFVDECGLNVKAGDGGAGCVSFRREAHVDRGGPDGGDGGNGGDIWLVADHNVASLLAFRDYPHRKAESGKHGSGKRRHGANGNSEFINVPVGTLVKDPVGNILADLSSTGTKWLAAAGGRGGKGNSRFLSNRRRAPSFAEQGEHGEEQWLNLELKLLADVALVGFPNVGKSTLISRVSAAKPKIADYPFTTLVPNLGVVKGSEEFEMVIADIPGLIEGAADGKGLGHQFLRHVERARVLAILLDLSPYDGRGVEHQLEILLEELRTYKPELLDRPRLLISSKADVATQAALEGSLKISSITGEGVQEMKYKLERLVKEARETENANSDEIVIHRPAPKGISVLKEGNIFTVKGRQAERAVSLNDLTNIEALEYIQFTLEKIGVNKALRKAGIRQGNLVQIGELQFEYMDDDEHWID
ncbi:GTPase ObgE [bacterium]|nr:GTPase ObgE [bacterium]|tara:strand:+ start:164 stop:1420 length:1257 start_codon:yes stop_codon:yes gene_type:complete